MKTNRKIIRVAIVFTIVLAGTIIYWIALSRSNQQGGIMQTVISKDGTTIAYEKSGQGKPVILIGGALATHSAHADLAKLLSRNFTVYNFDRRGRGDSGDTKPYAVQREIEDVKALIDEAGGSAYVYGISSGACLALETTAALGEPVKKLAVYEPPYDDAAGVAEKWKEYSSKLDKLVAEDRRGDAVTLHMKTVGASDVAILAMKVMPGWSAMKAVAHTIPYDVAVVGGNRAVPVERVAHIKVKTLVMDGGASVESMPFMRATAEKLATTIPHAQHRVLEDQDHNVDDETLADALTEFFVKEK